MSDDDELSHDEATSDIKQPPTDSEVDVYDPDNEAERPMQTWRMKSTPWYEKAWMGIKPILPMAIGVLLILGALFLLMPQGGPGAPGSSAPPTRNAGTEKTQERFRIRRDGVPLVSEEANTNTPTAVTVTEDVRNEPTASTENADTKPSCPPCAPGGGETQAGGDGGGQCLPPASQTSMLHRSSTPGFSPPLNMYRFASLLDRLKLGEPIRIGVVGGSVSVGHGLNNFKQDVLPPNEVFPELYHSIFVEWLKQAYPVTATHSSVDGHAFDDPAFWIGRNDGGTSEEQLKAENNPKTHTVLNRAVPGATSLWPGFCLHTLFGERLPDLILAEFAFNDPGAGRLDLQQGPLTPEEVAAGLQYGLMHASITMERITRLALTDTYTKQRDHAANIKASEDTSPNKFTTEVGPMLWYIYSPIIGHLKHENSYDLHTVTAEHYSVPVTAVNEFFDQQEAWNIVGWDRAKYIMGGNQRHPNEAGHDLMARLWIRDFQTLSKMYEQNARTAFEEPRYIRSKRSDASLVATLESQPGARLPAKDGKPAAKFDPQTPLTEVEELSLPLTARQPLPIPFPLHPLSLAAKAGHTPQCRLSFFPFAPLPNPCPPPCTPWGANEYAAYQSAKLGAGWILWQHPAWFAKAGWTPEDKGKAGQLLTFELPQVLESAILVSFLRSPEGGMGQAEAWLTCKPESEGDGIGATERVLLDGHWDASAAQASGEFVIPTAASRKELWTALAKRQHEGGGKTGEYSEGDREFISKYAVEQLAQLQKELNCQLKYLHIQMKQAGLFTVIGYVTM